MLPSRKAIFIACVHLSSALARMMQANVSTVTATVNIHTFLVQPLVLISWLPDRILTHKQIKRLWQVVTSCFGYLLVNPT